MRSPVNSLLLLAALIVVAAPGPAGAGQDRQPSLTVTGAASQAFQPDQARLGVGVQNLAPTAAEAATRNAAVMQRMLAAVNNLLGPGDRLQTLGYRLSVRTRWNKQRQSNEVTGYQAEHRVQITTKDPQRLGRLLDAAVGAGANLISGPEWSLADEAAARRRVQGAAVADARAQALVLARAAGLALGPMIEMRTGGTPGPRNNVRLAKMAAAPTPLEAGQVIISAQVVCVFALQPGP